MIFKNLQLKEFLDFYHNMYNCPDFMVDDPVSIPHKFTKYHDIEISAFLTAILSWGKRSQIIIAAQKLMKLMQHKPYEFILYSNEKELQAFNRYVYRTFNSTDLLIFIHNLKRIYSLYPTLEDAFLEGGVNLPLEVLISNFRRNFFRGMDLERTHKHLPDPLKGSAAKRMNLFLRWMVRHDANGVDFGIWKKLKPMQLICPLDTHSGATARKLGLLQRRQNDWKAAVELTNNLKLLDKEDPVKYDFALFGLGWYEKF